MNELVVLVDKSGKPTGGTLPKLEAHHANTPLHIAFSCYVFNDKGEFLVTQRAKSKKVWPGVWTNSVCGHPAPGEDMIDAIKRRLEYELGMEAADYKMLVPDYEYKTPPFNGIIENEFCPIYIARATSQPKPNSEEVEDYKWMNWKDYSDAAGADKEDIYSWWCKDQLKKIGSNDMISEYSESKT